MAGIMKQQHEKIQEAAMEIVASFTIARFDAIGETRTRVGISRGWSYQLVAQFGITMQTARKHITRAYSRQQNPNWQPPPDTWGGKRDGAGISN